MRRSTVQSFSARKTCSGNLFKVRAFRRKGGKGKAPVGFEVQRPWTKQVTAVLRDVCLSLRMRLNSKKGSKGKLKGELCFPFFRAFCAESGGEEMRRKKEDG